MSKGFKHSLVQKKYLQPTFQMERSPVFVHCSFNVQKTRGSLQFMRLLPLDRPAQQCTFITCALCVAFFQQSFLEPSGGDPGLSGMCMPQTEDSSYSRVQSSEDQTMRLHCQPVQGSSVQLSSLIFLQWVLQLGLCSSFTFYILY